MKKKKKKSTRRLDTAAAVRAVAGRIAHARQQLTSARHELAALTAAGAVPHMVSAGKWADPAAALERRREAILKLPGVVACGLGHKSRSGIDTHAPALVVFVRKKILPEVLTQTGQQRLPQFLRVGRRRVEIDIVEMQPLEPHATVGSIGPASASDSGTIGCLAFDVDTRRPVLITAGHIVGLPTCTDPNPSPTDPFTVPALFDDPGAPVIGSVEIVTTLGVDAARISVTDGDAVGPFLPPVRIVGWRPPADDVDTSVTMFGKMSGLQSGVIKYVDVTIPEFCLQSTLLVSISTEPGDSGAGLVDSSSLLLGFLFGRAPSSLGPFRVFCPASLVMRRLGCTIP
jgi:hypothetical protein